MIQQGFSQQGAQRGQHQKCHAHAENHACFLLGHFSFPADRFQELQPPGGYLIKNIRTVSSRSLDLILLIFYEFCDFRVRFDAGQAHFGPLRVELFRIPAHEEVQRKRQGNHKKRRADEAISENHVEQPAEFYRIIVNGAILLLGNHKMTVPVNGTKIHIDLSQARFRKSQIRDCPSDQGKIAGILYFPVIGICGKTERALACHGRQLLADAAGIVIGIRGIRRQRHDQGAVFIFLFQIVKSYADHFPLEAGDPVIGRVMDDARHAEQQTAEIRGIRAQPLVHGKIDILSAAESLFSARVEEHDEIDSQRVTGALQHIPPDKLRILGQQRRKLLPVKNIPVLFLLLDGLPPLFTGIAQVFGIDLQRVLTVLDLHIKLIQGLYENGGKKDQQRADDSCGCHPEAHF